MPGSGSPCPAVDLTPSPDRSRSVLWMTAGALASPRANRAAVIPRSIQVAVDDPLVRHKTLNYWRKQIAWSQARQEGADEVLCVTPDGLVCEGTRTNIFFMLGPRADHPAARTARSCPASCAESCWMRRNAWASRSSKVWCR